MTGQDERLFNAQIYVVCLDKSHPTKSADVARLQRVDDGYWTALGSSRQKPGDMSVGPQVERWLRGDAPTSRVARKGRTMADTEYRTLPDPSERVRHVFQCKLCHLTATVRAEKLAPVLDEIASAWLKVPEAWPPHPTRPELPPRPWPMRLPLGVLAAKV